MDSDGGSNDDGDDYDDRICYYLSWVPTALFTFS